MCKVHVMYICIFIGITDKSRKSEIVCKSKSRANNISLLTLTFTFIYSAVQKFNKRFESKLLEISNIIILETEKENINILESIFF